MAEDNFGCQVNCATCAAAGTPSPSDVQTCVAARDFDAEPLNSARAQQPDHDSTADYISLNRGVRVLVHKCEHGWAYGWVNSCGPGWFPHGYVVVPAVTDSTLCQLPDSTLQNRGPCDACKASGQPGPAGMHYGWASCDFDPLRFHALHGRQLSGEDARLYVTLTKDESLTVDGCEGGWAHGWGRRCGTGWFPHSFVQQWLPSAGPSSPATGQVRSQPLLAPPVDDRVALACF